MFPATTMQKLTLLLFTLAVFAVAYSAPTANNRKRVNQQLYTNPYDYLPRDQQDAIIQSLARGFFAAAQNDEQAKEQFWGALAGALLPFAIDAIQDGK